MQSKPRLISVLPQDAQPQAIDAPRKSPNRYRSKLTPQMAQRIADECRVRGCVQTAKVYGITVGLALELRIEALDRLLRKAA